LSDLHVNRGQGHLKVMYDTDDEETQGGQRPWLPPSRGAGRGRGLLAASQWSPDSAEAAVGRTTLVDTVPMGCGRPRGDATTCPMDESMTSHPTVIEPGQAGRGGGGRVINAYASHRKTLSSCRLNDLPEAYNLVNRFHLRNGCISLDTATEQNGDSVFVW